MKKGISLLLSISFFLSANPSWCIEDRESLFNSQALSARPATFSSELNQTPTTSMFSYAWHEMQRVYADTRGELLPAQRNGSLWLALKGGIRAFYRAYTEPSRADRLAMAQLIRNGLFKDTVVVHEKDRAKGLAIEHELRFSFYGFKPKNSWQTAEEISGVILNGERRIAKDLSPGERDRMAHLLKEKRKYLTLRKGDPAKTMDAIHQNDYYRYIRHVELILERNPYSIISRDEKTKEIAGVVFCALGYAEKAEDLPSTWPQQSVWHHHHQSGKRNALVDFWFTGATGGIAVATLKASFELAAAAQVSENPNLTVEDGHIFAYSNIRTLWKYPHFTAAEMVEAIKQGTRKDFAISGHYGRGAIPAHIFEKGHLLNIGRGAVVVMQYIKWRVTAEQLHKYAKKNRRRAKRFKVHPAVLSAA